MTATKVVWKSKTVWFNVLSAGVSLAAALLTPGLVSDPHILAEIAAFITVGNVLLRLFGTSTALTLSAQPQPHPFDTLDVRTPQPPSAPPP